MTGSAATRSGTARSPTAGSVKAAGAGSPSRRSRATGEDVMFPAVPWAAAKMTMTIFRRVTVLAGTGSNAGEGETSGACSR
jgi:hypothetical protein